MKLHQTELRKEGVRGNSAVVSQPCPSGHITADIMLRYASSKSLSATSFIRKTLYAIALRRARKVSERA